MNYDYFSQTEDRSTGLDVLDETLEELAGRKLLLFASYRMTNRNLVEYLKPHNGVAIYGDITPNKQRDNLDRFIEDPDCRVLIAQHQSAGYGIDGLQDVCSDVLFLESPLVPSQFHQAVARLYRQGQKHNVNVRIAIAENTIQVKLHRDLMSKDELANLVQGAWEDLRDAIYGVESRLDFAGS